MVSLAKVPWGVVERWLAERDKFYLRNLVINLKVISLLADFTITL